MQSARQVVFIVGCPRSGTSVTKKIVRRHPGLASCGIEHNYLLDLFDMFGEKQIMFSEALSVLEEHRGLAGDGFVDTARSARAASFRLDSAQFCETIWRAATDDDEDKPLLLQYAGPGLLRANELLAVFPNARFVVLTRDPRANISSQMLGLGDGRSTLRSINLWRECQAATTNLLSESPKASLDVPYEAFVQNTEHWLRRICSFLGLPWDSGLVNFDVPMATMGVDGHVTRSSFDRLEPAMNEKWRKALSPSQVSLIETMCRKEMEALGYERTGRRLQLSDLPFLAQDVLDLGRARVRATMG